MYASGYCGESGEGGWAFVVAHDDGCRCSWGKSHQLTTQKAMELQSVVKAIEFSNETPEVCCIVSESAYVINGIHKWLDKWANNDWLTATHNPVKHTQLWRSIYNNSSGKVFELNTDLNNFHFKIAAKLAHEAALDLVVDFADI